MPFLSLSNELLLCVSENLGSEEDIHALELANQQLHHLLNSLLYRYNIQHSGCSALLWVSEHGREATVRRFLSADIKPQDEHYGKALQAASAGGHETIVRLLLEKGANINSQNGVDGNVLQAASAEGHEVIVRLLLEKGADVNAQGGAYSNALQAASVGGHEAIVKLLLHEGAGSANGAYFNPPGLSTLPSRYVQSPR